VALTSWWALNF